MSPEQILALAPDASSATAGKGLANARKWANLGANESAIWGECQGSGSKPYQAQIDPSEPAFKCSCPSRKFPCKHGLGLYLLFANQKDLFGESTPPEWVEKWLESRQERAQKSAQKAEEKATKEVDPIIAAATAAKRSANREAKVEAGLRELELWLHDLVRGGLAGAPAQPYSFWDVMGARLVDAQCPTLARHIRELAGVSAMGRGWQQEMLARLAHIHLVIEGWKRRDTLNAEVVAELRTQIGWTFKEHDLDETDAVEDEWWVLGQRSEEEEQIRIVKTWLWGVKSKRFATYLQFGHISQPLVPQFVPFTRLRAKAVFYPGVASLRATFREKSAIEALDESTFDFATSIAASTARYAHMLAQNPWLDAVPVALANTSLLQKESNWLVRDGQGDEWPLSSLFTQHWQFLATSGGAPVTLFGEWNGTVLWPFHWVVGALGVGAQSVEANKTATESAKTDSGEYLP